MLPIDNISIIHRPFWVLLTQEVNYFMSSAINRWIFAIEALASRSVARSVPLPPVGYQEQCLNGVMISALVRTLQMIFGGAVPQTKPELWRST